MRDYCNIPVKGRHFAFVEVTTVTKYHTLLLDGSELGAEARVRDMVDRYDSALCVQSSTTRSIDVRLRPVQKKHLEARSTRVVVHEEPRDPHRWTWTAEAADGVDSITHPVGMFPDIGSAIADARRSYGNDADVSIQAEGYPGDGCNAEPLPTPADVLKFLDYFAGQENTAEEVRDFVQKVARFLDERKPVDEWMKHPELAGFLEWVKEQAS